MSDATVNGGSLNRLIQEYPGAVPASLCGTLINRFEHYAANPEAGVVVEDKLATDGWEAEDEDDRPPKNASVIYLVPDRLQGPAPDFFGEVIELGKHVMEAAARYREEMGALLGQPLNPVMIQQLDLMKYHAGAGYYDAHADAFERSVGWRVLSAVVYLNDVPEGGETEFTFAGRQVSPEQGKVLLFPSFFGCAHRSLLVGDTPKYIVAAFLSFA